MTHVSGWEYAAVFAVTSVLTLLLTPMAIRLALRRGILDHPGEIKAQSSPVPYLGGAAIVIAFSAAVLGAAAVRLHGGIGELATIVGLGILLAAMGLLDDLRGLSPWFRLAVEVSVGAAVWVTPAGAEVFRNDIADLAVTVAWVVGVTNAFNLLDNMDGLSAGVAGIAALFTFAMAAHNGQFLVATLAVATAGCSVGFLRSNFHPARVYMGDAGSLFLGFTLSVLALKLKFVHAPKIVALGVPIVLLGVPLFDTVLVTCNRVAHGRSPLSGGRDHTSHRLVFVGVGVPAAVTLIYLGAASLGTLAVVLSRVDRNTGLLLLGWIGLVAVLLGVLLSLVPIYGASRRWRLMVEQVAPREPEGEPDC